MTISRKNFLASGIALALTVAAGCGKATTPTGAAVTGSAPTIASLSPSSPEPSAATQTLSVSGTNFFTGLTFTLRAPDGSSSLYSSASISGQTSTGFSVSVLLPTPGSWSATVKNVDGLESTAIPFTVGTTSSSGPPQILAITPGTLTRSASIQSFSINGQNFRAGATVVVTNPNGSEIQTSISSQTDTIIVATATFVSSGTYTVVVRNSDGSTSGLFSLTVNP